MFSLRAAGGALRGQALLKYEDLERRTWHVARMERAGSSQGTGVHRLPLGAGVPGMPTPRTGPPDRWPVATLRYVYSSKSQRAGRIIKTAYLLSQGVFTSRIGVTTWVHSKGVVSKDHSTGSKKMISGCFSRTNLPLSVCGHAASTICSLPLQMRPQ